MENNFEILNNYKEIQKEILKKKIQHSYPSLIGITVILNLKCFFKLQKRFNHEYIAFLSRGSVCSVCLDCNDIDIS